MTGLAGEQHQRPGEQFAMPGLPGIQPAHERIAGPGRHPRLQRVAVPRGQPGTGPDAKLIRAEFPAVPDPGDDPRQHGPVRLRKLQPELRHLRRPGFRRLAQPVRQARIRQHPGLRHALDAVRRHRYGLVP